MIPGHRQGGFQLRFDWGLTGAVAVTADVEVAVVVDVLSFTTALSVAIDRGTAVLPYRWRDDSARDFARAHGAELAVGRSETAERGGLSLSPASIRTHPAPPRRLVLPSPNGSTISRHFRTAGTECLGASLRNAVAVGNWLDRRGGRRSVAVIAAGEKWPDGSLRPAVEDAWGAGAVIAELARLGWSDLSPEADFARATYEAVRGREAAALLACASGQELLQRGYRADVEIAAEIDASSLVPRLAGDQFVAAPA